MSKKLLLSLIGPPGSGKGSYGRHLAKSLDCSLIGMSDVLREMRPDLDLSSGKLVDDSVVEHTLQHFLSRQSHDSSRGYLLDGYPRTVGQLQGTISIDAVILLAVPDFVCESKLLGRRLCRKCDGNFNINGVDQDGWCQPPILPTKPQCSEDSCGWETRLDDNAEVVRSRLKTYHDHADPIVKHFEQRDRILKLKPYNGFDDLPKVLETAREFVKRI
jgi:adenylate kinase